MTKQKESFIFYRSFKESISDLNDSEKLIMYEAISDYALDQVEPALSGFPKTLFRLIRPQIDANFKRWKNGCKGGAPLGNTNAKKQPKNNQDLTKKQPKTTEKQPNENENDNDNENVNDKKEKNRKEKAQLSTHLQTEEEIRFAEGMKKEFPNVMKLNEPLTYAQYVKLAEMYSADVVKDKLNNMENKVDLTKKYRSAYRTLNQWCKK